jgi:hypothetical protein
MSVNKTPTPEVLEIGQIAFKGNIIPHSWYQKLKLPSGKVNLQAITVLSEICYWYRPTEVRDEYTGCLLRLEKKFHSDKLQRSYESFSSLGLTRDQAYRACHYLQDEGLITLESRTITTNTGIKIPHVLFIGINPKAIKELNMLSVEESSVHESTDLSAQMHNPYGIEPQTSLHRNDTYTESTTKSTTDIFDQNFPTAENPEPNVREVKEKSSAPFNPRQQKAFKNDGFTLPLDFKLEYDIIQIALSLGYSDEDIQDEFVRFLYYYTKGKGHKFKYLNWYHKFVHEWLNNNYKNGRIKRNGKLYKSDANTERSESIRKLLDPNLFADISD